jgi:phytol kinase
VTDLLKILGVTGALAAFFQLANYGGKHWSWPAEFRRKLIHIGMGAVVIWFPWIFDSIWPVWILATLSIAAFCLLRMLSPLQRGFGEVLHGVKRQSWGEFCWPFSVALLFSLTHSQPLFYVIPVLVLALADAGGAMVGTRYGSARYQTDDGQKSAEGSLAVFLVAFLATHISLLLFTPLGRLECLLVGFVLGLIATLTEAIAWRGLDNFFVPIATYACLVRLVELGVTILVVHLVVLILLLVALHFCILRTYLTRSASTAAALVLYVSWTAGDWHWLIAPLATLAGYVALCPEHQTRPKMHNVEAITLVASAGLLWLALSHLLPKFDTLYAYGVAYGANLSFIALAFFAHRSRRLPLLVAGVLAWTLGYALLAIPYFMVWHEHPRVLTLALAAALTLAICLGIFMKWQPSLKDCPNDSARWLRQTAMAGLASLVAFFVINALDPTIGQEKISAHPSRVPLWSVPRLRGRGEQRGMAGAHHIAVCALSRDFCRSHDRAQPGCGLATASSLAHHGLASEARSTVTPGLFRAGPC